MPTIDVVSPLKAHRAKRVDEYREAVFRLDEAGAAPTDAEEIRFLSDLLTELGRPPERLQEDLRRLEKRRTAIADLEKARQMTERAIEQSREAKQLESESYSQSVDQGRETRIKAATCNDRYASLTREARDLRNWAQRDMQSTGEGHSLDGFRPLTDEEWEASRESDAKLYAALERAKPEPFAYTAAGAR